MAVGKTNIYTGGGNLPLTVGAADVRLGKTFTRDCKTAETGTLNLNNLKAENIKNGVNIADVLGTFSPAGMQVYKFVHQTFLQDIPNSPYRKLLKVSGLPFKPEFIFFTGFERYSGTGGNPIFMYSDIDSVVNRLLRASVPSFVAFRSHDNNPYQICSYGSDKFFNFRVNNDGFQMEVVKQEDFFKTITGYCIG